MQGTPASTQSEARRSAGGEQRSENIGRIEEIRGVVVDAVFHERLFERLRSRMLVRLE